MPRKTGPRVHTLLHISEAAPTRDRNGLLCPMGKGSPGSKEPPSFGFGVNLSGPAAFYPWCHGVWAPVAGCGQGADRGTADKAHVPRRSRLHAVSKQAPVWGSDTWGLREGGNPLPHLGVKVSREASRAALGGGVTRRGGHCSGGNWREEDVRAGTTVNVQKPARVLAEPEGEAVKRWTGSKLFITSPPGKTLRSLPPWGLPQPLAHA